MSIAATLAGGSPLLPPAGRRVSRVAPQLAGSAAPPPSRPPNRSDRPVLTHSESTVTGRPRHSQPRVRHRAMTLTGQGSGRNRPARVRAVRVSDSSRVLFVHVPKTGGSTIDAFFDREVDDARRLDTLARHSPSRRI